MKTRAWGIKLERGGRGFAEESWGVEESNPRRNQLELLWKGLDVKRSTGKIALPLAILKCILVFI